MKKLKALAAKLKSDPEAVIAAAEAASDAEAAGEGKEKKSAPKSLMGQGWDKLKEQVKKLGTKLKEYAQAPGKLLKTLGRLDPKALAAALGPALKVAAAVGAVGAVGAAGLYAVANEREDARQVERPELEAIEEQLEQLGVTTTTLQETPPATVLAASASELAALQDVVDNLEIPDEPVLPSEQLATAAELAALREDLEDLDLADPDEVAALTERINGLNLADPADIAELQTAVDALNIPDPERLAALEEQIAGLETVTPDDLAAIEQQITALPDAPLEQITALEEAVAALEAVNVEPFDPSVLEAADAANTAAIEANLEALETAQTAVEAAQAEAAAASQAAEELAVALTETETALADIETVFFADLERQWDVGVPVIVNVDNGCSGEATIFQRPAGSFAASIRTPGTTENFCVEFTAEPPTIPAKCSLPSVGSLQFFWEHGQVTTSASFGATSGNTTIIRDANISATGGTNGSFFLTQGVVDGPDASNTSPAGEALQFVSPNFDQWAHKYRILATVNYGVAGTGSTPSVSAGVESVTARVRGTLTCEP